VKDQSWFDNEKRQKSRRLNQMTLHHDNKQKHYVVCTFKIGGNHENKKKNQICIETI
jgi:hypothetical protein